MPRTLYDKIWDAHVVRDLGDEAILYIDLHLLGEVTTPQAFAGLRAEGRRVRRPERTLAVADHNTPTENQSLGLAGVVDPAARLQLETLARNAEDFGIAFYPMGHLKNGIVHVVAPEQGLTLPGTTIACGDSHTSTHGAFGALAYGVGTSEVEHILATQTLRQRKSRNMRVTVEGALPFGVTAKDMALFIVGRIGVAGGQGHVIEFAGSAVRGLSMEGRMTLCNLAVEAGARAALIAPDACTIDYLSTRPIGMRADWAELVTGWRALASDTDAHFDREVEINSADLAPMVTWGTSPGQVAPVTGATPVVEASSSASVARALTYMGLEPGRRLEGLPIDVVFIGSCTNSRLEDLKAAAEVAKNRRVSDGVRAMVVPGSAAVRREAEALGLDRVFRDAGFEWREPGCSMCLGMNPDQLSPGQRCASTSNRNFEGRQGRGGRTHLMSPAMAAAAAVAGRIVDVRGEFG